MIGFIFFGWPVREKSIGKVAPGLCGHCQNQSIWHLTKHRRWLTLFFLPVFPLSKKSHYLVCDLCGIGVEIEDEEVTDTKQLMDMTAGFTEGEFAESEYVETVNQFWRGLNAVEEPAESEPEQIKGIQ